MSVIVDTCVWSTAFRRGTGTEVDVLRELILSGQAALLGPIRQETLQGLRDQRKFEQVRSRLAAFPDVALEPADYETAASYFNTCRKSGIQGSSTDFLICAAASRRGVTVYTTDADFRRFARHLPVRLYSPAVP